MGVTGFVSAVAAGRVLALEEAIDEAFATTRSIAAALLRRSMHGFRSRS
jgi:hypothetical protein